MTYETKNITFHVICVKVSSKSRCLRALPMSIGKCGVYNHAITSLKLIYALVKNASVMGPLPMHNSSICVENCPFISWQYVP